MNIQDEEGLYSTSQIKIVESIENADSDRGLLSKSLEPVPHRAEFLIPKKQTTANDRVPNVVVSEAYQDNDYDTSQSSL